MVQGQLTPLYFPAFVLLGALAASAPIDLWPGENKNEQFFNA